MSEVSATRKSMIAAPPYTAMGWGGLLAFVLAIAGWAYLSKAQDKALSIQAQLEPNQNIYWKSGYPRIGGAITLGNAKPATISAKNFAFEAWGKAEFLFNFFGAGPLAEAHPGVFGVPTIELRSHADMDAAELVRLHIWFYGAATWRSLEAGNATLLIRSLATSTDDSYSRIHGLVDVNGVDGSAFKVTAREGASCAEPCQGTFAKFNGDILLSNPPQYRGPGAKGVTRVSIASSPEPALNVRGYEDGFTLFAVQPTEFHVDEYAEKVEFRANRGSLTFNGQLFPLGPTAPLKIAFSESSPARLEISHNKMAVLNLDGAANELYLGSDDLMPRLIDSWPWYWQVLLGAIISFCGERLFNSLRNLELKATIANLLSYPSINPSPADTSFQHSASAPAHHTAFANRGTAMTAFNAVRFKVKQGRDQEFLDAHNDVAAAWPGLRHVNIIKTGEQRYCIIAEWDSTDAIVAARPAMIATLDTFRDTLDDLGGGLGLTDPVSGPVVLALK